MRSVRLAFTRDKIEINARATGTSKRAKIDIHKEAAIEIGMLHEGIARVRIEVLPETNTSATTASAAP
ncbi:MAG: hypothetical protein ABR514_09850 [Chthoniobacterales bacterium]